MDFPYEKDNKERIPLEHYLSEYRNIDPKEAAERCGVEYDEEKQQFHIRLMGFRYLVDFPEFAVHKEDENEEGAFLLLDMVPAKIIVLRFLISAQVVKSSGKYLTYREVPWGEVYFRQFEGRCLMRLKFGFGFKLDKFAEGMEKIPGVKKLSLGDVSYEFEFINGLHVRFILWAGDEEFPPSSQILFEDNFPYAYQAEDLAVVGDISISTLKALAA
ncbi:DUF3786 domain-containing protein [Lachnoclostridium sp. An138]|uniref:DUF3786 domain-containing protein n=1 Tax=Lachnoclostridium sp. An138 TaxID=1965560 RepID=UPI000B3B052F|nr:DUF3786 domain-containing protein [Lachnoclostridium sp. An138]OUQ16459.1 hypothetical protein B5E82_13425 [Lachnoclostridium sp. An138]